MRSFSFDSVMPALPITRRAASLGLHLGLAVTLAASAAGACAQTTPGSAATAGQAAPAIALRKEIAVPMMAAQDLMKAQQFSAALARIAEADAVLNKSAQELLVIERTRAIAATGAGDVATATKSWNTVLASGQLGPAERQKVMQALYGMYFNAKDYAQAIEWMNRYAKEGGADPAMRPTLVRAYYLSGDTARATTELDADLKAEVAAGRMPAEDSLKLLVLIAEKQADKNAYAAAVERLATYYPKKEYSGVLLSRVLTRPGFSQRLSLDVYRLRLANGPLKSAADYADAAQLALQAGFPAEARKIVEMGYQANLLGTGPDAAMHKKLKDQATRAAADDLKTMDAGIAGAKAAKDGTGLTNLGYAYVTAGQADKGLPLMESGIAKGGLKHPDDAKLHLGVAQLAAGKKPEAIQTFKSVQGSDGTADLARLWVMQANLPVQ